MSARLPTYYLSHGGGPWPWMKAGSGGAFDALERSLVEVGEASGPKPKAVLVVSGHWEERAFTVSAAERPGMVYDYSGFPEHTYSISYPAPGSPELATRVQDLLRGGGMDCQSDPQRGYDHGTFSLLKPMFPDADVPVVQLSLKSDLDPQEHIDAGRLLEPLRDEGVLILGSGSSYHNLRRRDASARAPANRFDAWLQSALVGGSGEARNRLIERWLGAPDARDAHPREDHLLPLMVAVGAAEDEPGACIFRQQDFLGFWTVSSFRFGAAAS